MFFVSKALQFMANKDRYVDNSVSFSNALFPRVGVRLVLYYDSMKV